MLHSLQVHFPLSGVKLSVSTASGHHNAVCEDPDGGDAQDLQTSTLRVRFPGYVKV